MLSWILALCSQNPHNYYALARGESLLYFLSLKVRGPGKRKEKEKASLVILTAVKFKKNSTRLIAGASERLWKWGGHGRGVRGSSPGKNFKN